MPSPIPIGTQYWWFGINNTKDPRKGHIRIGQILSFLQGRAPKGEFAWMYGGSTWSLRYYADMRAGDQMIFWVGHDPQGFFPDWGIQGFGSIKRIEGQPGDPQSTYVLEKTSVPTGILTPYPGRQRTESRNVQLLSDVFGEDFLPLSETFGRAQTFITVWPTSQAQFNKVFEHCRRLAA